MSSQRDAAQWQCHSLTILRPTLLGQETGVSEETLDYQSPVNVDHFVILPSERCVSASDTSEVVLWDAQAVMTDAPRVLPLAQEPLPKAHSRLTTASVELFEPAWKKVVRGALVVVMCISLVVMSAVVIPDLLFRFQGEEQVPASQLAQGNGADGSQLVQPTPTPAPVLPPVDTTLPEGKWLVIPKIGVDATVTVSDNPDEALKQGAWMVPDFGRPLDYSQPTIIASHRYGWLSWWKTDFGRKNSFYYLPDVTRGDRIEVIDDQRKFRYEIYAKEEGQEITDYTADLILYTCKFLNSPVRYFVYARRLDESAQLSTLVLP